MQQIVSTPLILFNSLSHSIDGPPDLPLSVSAETARIEMHTVDIRTLAFDLLWFGKAVNSVFGSTKYSKSYKWNVHSGGC